MSRGNASGYRLDRDDARIVLGMDARGDRHHDIAAWFGVNQGRIAGAKNGDFGTLEAAPASELPPQGPPGIKGRRLRAVIEKVLEELDGDASVNTIRSLLENAVQKYDSNEA